MKHCKTFYEAQTESRLKEVIKPSPKTTLHQIKSYCFFGTDIFLRRYTKIYRHLISKCFKNAVLGRQERVQYKETCLLENL